MSQINTPRVILGGLVAGTVINVFEGLGGILYLEEMMAALEAREITLDTTGLAWGVRVLMGFVLGWVAIWFYAAVRPRFGPGPKTAAMVGLALWFGGNLLSIAASHFLGIFPNRVLVIWGVLGLAELIVATLAGAWMYSEDDES